MKYLHEESGVTYGSLREFRRVSGIAFPADPTGGDILGMLGLKQSNRTPERRLRRRDGGPWRNSTACFWISGRIGRR